MLFRSQIDFAFAKAKLSLDMQATMPLINNEGYVNLRQARHPLIPASLWFRLIFILAEILIPY